MEIIRSRSKHYFLYLLTLVLILILPSCQKKDAVRIPDLRFTPGVYPNKDITDGPFVFDNGNWHTVKWIEKNSTVIEKTMNEENSASFEADFGFSYDLVNAFLDEPFQIDYVQEFSNVKNLVAISDIHGQYEIFISLLRSNNVIDEYNNWSFGQGHLVVNGDVFDRGKRVTEILWMLFKLEYQAKQAGGKLHYLLGNHEVMVLNNDLRYVDSQYLSTAEKLGTSYNELYSKRMVIGQWLRTKPVIVKINDMIFNHAGISPDFVDQNLNPEMVNRLFLENIIDADSRTIDKDPLLDFLAGSDGPVWYRGYFEDDDGFSVVKLNSILKHLNSHYIIVGHTSMEGIKFYYNGKIIAIDSSIKNGMTGEVLIYKEGVFSVGTII